MDKRAEAARRLLDFRVHGLGFGASPGLTVFLIITNVLCASTIFFHTNTVWRIVLAALMGLWAGLLAGQFIWQLVIRSRWRLVCELIDWERVELLARQGAEEAASHQ